MPPHTIAFSAICLDNGKFGLGAAELDQPGYWPQPQLGEFDTFHDAYVEARKLNTERLGLDDNEAARIVASSMFKQNTGRKRV